MKRVGILGILAVGLALLAGHPSRAGAYTSIAADIEFYNDLTPYGDWEYVGNYGQCWVPHHRTRSWRPYTVGYWVDTEYGWMWISQDPWGDIPYHYGRWAFAPGYGYVWVPDDDMIWAPAWVSWRYSDSYVGWAPLPPSADWGGSGFSIDISLVDRSINRSSWCFAPTRSFGTERVRYSILPPTQNVTIYASTRNVTRYTTYNGVPTERGLRPELIERATGRRIQRYQVTDTRSPARMTRSAIRGRSIEVYRPRITGARQRAPQFVPSLRTRGNQGRDEARMRREQRVQQQRGAERARQNEIRRQQQAEMRRDAQERRRYEQQRGDQQQQPRGSERRREPRRRYQDQGQGQGQPDGNPGQGQGQERRREYRDRGQGGNRGQGAPQGQGQPPPQGQDQNRGKRGRGRDKDQGQGQGQGQGQDQNDQDKDRGHGRGHGR